MLVAVVGTSFCSLNFSSLTDLTPKCFPHFDHIQKLLSLSATSDMQHTKNIILDQKTWMFQAKYPISYEVASNADIDVNNKDVEVVPILLLNGFGVGSFHQHRLMRNLLLEHDEQKEKKQQYVIYGIDYLGQGQSWPANCDDGNSNDELNLGYSADTWLKQLKGFIEEVVIPSSTSSKVHLVGNSVGGYLSTILANRHPQLIDSLTLLNATPVWGLNLPGWNGKLPAPPLPKMVGRKLFDTIRNLDVIDWYLEQAYFYREAHDGSFDDSFHGYADDVRADRTLRGKIRACTEGKGGHAAFASILWSSPASVEHSTTLSEAVEYGMGPPELVQKSGDEIYTDFYGALENLPVDVLLLFGSDDPWCTPAIAKRMHSTLASRGGTAGQRYVSFENVGHCPNHEAPTAVVRVLLPWIGSQITDEQQRSKVPLVSESSQQIREPWGVVNVREVPVEESRDLGLMDQIISSLFG